MDVICLLIYTGKKGAPKWISTAKGKNKIAFNNGVWYDNRVYNYDTPSIRKMNVPAQRIKTGFCQSWQKSCAKPAMRLILYQTN